MNQLDGTPTAAMPADQGIRVKAAIADLRAAIRRHHAAPLHPETERHLETFAASLVQDMTDCSAHSACVAAKIFLAVSR